MLDYWQTLGIVPELFWQRPRYNFYNLLTTRQEIVFGLSARFSLSFLSKAVIRPLFRKTISMNPTRTPAVVADIFVVTLALPPGLGTTAFVLKVKNFVKIIAKINKCINICNIFLYNNIVELNEDCSINNGNCGESECQSFQPKDPGWQFVQLVNCKCKYGFQDGTPVCHGDLSRPFFLSTYSLFCCTTTSIF